MTDRLGRKGERLFSLLCAEAGVTCNPSLEDETGWDHFIEFPPKLLPRKALDLQPAHKAALVQVKTTRAARPSCRLKLSNAHRMAKSPTPFFVVAMAEQPDDRRLRIFGLHVWELQIARILKAVRVAEQAGRPDLHKQWLRIGWEHLTETDYLIDWIGNQIEAVGKDYAASKQKILQSVGFGDDRASITVTFDLDKRSALSDLMLGIGESIPIRRFVYSSRRFGISAFAPEVETEGGTLLIKPNPRRGTLRITAADGDTLSCDAAIFSSNGVETEGKVWRSRIVGGCLEILLDGLGNATAMARLNFASREPLDHIVQFAKLLTWRDRGPLTMLLTIGEVRVDLGTLDLDAGEKLNWPLLAMVTTGLERVAETDGRRQVLLSFEELCREAGALELFGALVGDNHLRLEYQPHEDAPERFDGGLSYMTVDVGKWSFSALAYRPIDDDTMIGDMRRLSFRSARLLEVRVEPRSMSRPAISLASSYATALARLQKTGSILEIEDFRSIVQNEHQPPNPAKLGYSNAADKST